MQQSLVLKMWYLTFIQLSLCGRYSDSYYWTFLIETFHTQKIRITIMGGNMKIGNVIQKKCCEETHCLFFFLTTEPHELKSKKTIIRNLYSSLPDVMCCSNTVLHYIEKFDCWHVIINENCGFLFSRFEYFRQVSDHTFQSPTDHMWVHDREI